MKHFYLSRTIGIIIFSICLLAQIGLFCGIDILVKWHLGGVGMALPTTVTIQLLCVVDAIKAEWSRNHEKRIAEIEKNKIP